MTKRFLEQVGERVQKLRESKGWDRGKLAYLCGVNAGNIFGIERGDYKPPYSLYEDICQVMGYTTKDLFGGFHWTMQVGKMKWRLLIGND